MGRLICDATNTMGIPCSATSDPGTFFRELTPEVTLIMLDLIMPKTDGIEILRLLAQQGCRIPIIFMSGVGKRILESAEQLAGSLGLSVVGHLSKPFRIDQLEAVLHRQIAEGSPRSEHAVLHIPIADEELRNAIVQEQFVVHYQPQVQLSNNRVVGIEALVRWKHPHRGLIFPDLFISRMETLGLIDQLGWIVATCGLKEFKQVVTPNGTPTVLSLNVSIFSLRDLQFTDYFMALLRQHDVSPHNIILEITESGLIKELSSTLDVLTRLRMKEVKLSVDDFGTGYAMMQQLRLVPATELKIDKSFVQNMHTSDSDRVMVQKTVEIGHDLGMNVVAEGVETIEQLEFLRSIGCDVVQGHLFSRPLPIDQLVAWIKRHEGI